jgi:hypothetical protein
MPDPVEQADGPVHAARAGTARVTVPVIAAFRNVISSRRRAALTGGAAALLAVAAVAPLGGGEVTSSVTFSIAFFATLLTGEAVIFALSFAPSSGWPSLREIDSHIAFREWVLAGWLAAMLTASGLLTHAAIPATYGALLFLLADAFGMFSFIRLFGLASAEGRKRLLRRTLASALAAATAAPEGALRQRMHDDRVLNAYLGQLDEAAARSDGNGVRDLADELAAAPGNGTATAALHLDVVHRLAKAALVGRLDPVVASGAAQVLLGSLLTRIPALGGDAADGTTAHQAAGALAQTSRYLAWLANTSLTMSARGVTPAGAARELVAFAVEARLRVRRLADPDPPYAAGTADLGTPLSDATSVLAWISGFTEFHGVDQAAGLYPVYQILTGEKFLGNYWDGDSVLTGLRAALFTPGLADSSAAQAARASFGTVEEFDRIWTLISVGAIATLRDARVTHPPELIRSEFTPDPQLLGAYLRTFASHRYVTSAAQAMTALVRTVGCAGQPGDLWHQVRAVGSQLSSSVPMPGVEAHRRPSACVLAMACRLAPLTSGEPDHELRTFLNALPPQILNATARLAARTIPAPDPGGEVTGDPADLITRRLRVLQLVGTHRMNPP